MWREGGLFSVKRSRFFQKPQGRDFIYRVLCEERLSGFVFCCVVKCSRFRRSLKEETLYIERVVRGTAVRLVLFCWRGVVVVGGDVWRAR